MLAPAWWRGRCRVGRCVVTNVGPTPESDLHVSVVDVEVGQVGSRVELFEEIRRDRRVEALSIRELDSGDGQAYLHEPGLGTVRGQPVDDTPSSVDNHRISGPDLWTAHHRPQQA